MKQALVGAIALLLVGAPPPAAGQAAGPAVRALKVTVLSTMLAGNPGEGVGEWGFAALIEADGRRLLVDTGARPDTVLRNAAELAIDLSSVSDVVITHNHGDHTGGLLALRRELAHKNPQALVRAHVAEGIFLSRLNSEGRETNGLLPIKAAYEGLGGTFVQHAGPVQLLPGVWLTGPVPRVHTERNWSASLRLQTPSGATEDTVPEDASLVVNAPAGLVVISGCGHAGIVNTLDYARKIASSTTIHAAIGGFHLFAATDDQLKWTAEQLRAGGLRYFLGVHCTGIEAVFRIRQLAALDRKTAAVGGVGATFALGVGLDPRQLAR